jgi:hypothetical protein
MKWRSPYRRPWWRVDQFRTGVSKRHSGTQDGFRRIAADLPHSTSGWRNPPGPPNSHAGNIGNATRQGLLRVRDTGRAMSEMTTIRPVAQVCRVEDGREY